MKRLLRSILVIITALSLIALTGCGLAKEVGSAVKSTVTEYVKDTAEELGEELGEALDNIPDREPITEIKSELSDLLKGEDEEYSDAVSNETDTQSAVSEEPETDIQSTQSESENSDINDDELAVDEDGTYTDKEHVALYIHTFGKLPSNYITKKEAKNQGWNSSKGNLNIVLPGMSIGGDRFGNREGTLPEIEGIKYFECDINYNVEENYDTPVYRGSERIIYSDMGTIYYTNDHYETFEQLY